MTEERAALLERLELARGRVSEMKQEDVREEFSDQLPAEIRVSLAAFTEAVCDFLGSCFFVMDRLGDSLCSILKKSSTKTALLEKQEN